MNKLFKYVIAVFFVGAIIVSCKKDKSRVPAANDPKGTLRVVFIPNYDGFVFDLNTDFYTPLNNRFQVEGLKFLLSEFWVKGTSGDSSYVEDAFRYDFEASTNSLDISLTPGSYSALKFSFGVPESINHNDPTVFPVEHPFSYNQSSDMIWTWSTGYIFAKFDGRLDTTSTNTGTLSQTFAIHPGTDTLYRELPWMNKSITIAANQITQVYVQFNVKKFLTDGTDTIDLENDNFSHTISNFQLAQRFTNLLIKSFSLQ